MRNKRYTVILATKGETIIQQTNKHQDVAEWITAYKANESAVEIQVFEREGMGYTRVVHEYKRRIGF